MDKLTSKEERYCTLVALEGLSQRQAYKEAYDTNATFQAMDVASSRLSQKAKIRLRIEQLRKSVVSPLILDKQQRMEMWSDMAKDETLKPIDRLRASELLAKADGDFVQRIETAGIQAKVDLSMYTTEDLKLMLRYMKEVGADEM